MSPNVKQIITKTNRKNVTKVLTIIPLTILINAKLVKLFYSLYSITTFDFKH